MPTNWPLYFLMTTLVATLFSAIGIIFGLFAEKFDHIAVFTTFVITPLVFVGGVFTSAQFLPPLVRQLSLFNPMFYMIDAFRFAFTGRSDVPLEVSIGIVIALTVVSVAVALRLTISGFKLRV
jgi:ABC-2 type transport system permease protein